MNPKAVALIAVVLLILFASANNNAPAPTPDDPSVPSDAPNFLPVFREFIAAGKVDRQSARVHAESLAGFCASTADAIEFDGTVTPPRIDTARKLIEMRTLARHYREKGGSYGELYPTMGPAIQEFMAARCGRDEQDGKDENTMTPELRHKYVDAFSGLSAAFLRAAREL